MSLPVCLSGSSAFLVVFVVLGQPFCHAQVFGLLLQRHNFQKGKHAHRLVLRN